MQERPGLADEGDEGIGGHVEGQREAVAGRVDEGPLEVLATGEGEGMDEDVELAVGRTPLVHDRPDLLVRLDIARLDERRSDRLRQRPDALLDQALDRREADERALVVERPGDAPGDRVVVGDPEDQGLLPVEQSHPRFLPAWRRA